MRLSEQGLLCITTGEARTLCDFRYVTRRFMKRCPGLERRRVRSITAAECAAYIAAAFETPRQRQKARLTLSGVFSTAMKARLVHREPGSAGGSPARGGKDGADSDTGGSGAAGAGSTGIQGRYLSTDRGADAVCRDLPPRGGAATLGRCGFGRQAGHHRPSAQQDRRCPPRDAASPGIAASKHNTSPCPATHLPATATRATTPPTSATCTSCSCKWATAAQICSAHGI